MAIFYNSVIDYENAGTAYNGVATVYDYTGSITITIGLNHNIFDGAHYVFTYTGRMTMNILLGSSYIRGFLRTPAISGISISVIPNSRIIIRKYYKFADPVRIGGCCFCGTYLYND